MIKVNRTVVWDATNHRIVEKETKTKGSVREVPVPLFCIELIKEYLKLRERIIFNFKRKDNSYSPPKNLFLGFSGGIMFPDTPSHKWVSFRKKNKLKKVTLHGLRHSYCSMQMNENSKLSPADVQKLMGHSQLSTTFLYTHSNKDKTEQAVSVFEEYYITNGEMKINFREILSLYTGVNFTTTTVINDLIKFIVNSDENLDKKYEIIRKYIITKYPKFKKIDITDLTVNNLWDWLEKKQQILGDEFIISPIIM